MAQAQDEILSQVILYCKEGWPEKNLKGPVKKFWMTRNELSLHDDLLLRGSRIVIPSDLKQEILQKLHVGHQGIVKCRLRAKASVWWPGISDDINTFIHKCDTCCKDFPNTTQPMIPTKLPERPWEKVASDLFELKGTPYIIVVDYFSRYVEVLKLTTTTSASIITALKTTFSRHSIPDTLVTDNGPQYSSQEFSEFAKSYDFKHQTSSPYHPQGNGEAECAVRTVKSLLKDCSDPHLALLSYRTTPLPFFNHSPAQLLISRHLCSPIPTLAQALALNWPDLNKFREVDDKYKLKIKKQYDRHHRVRELPVLDDEVPVYISGRRSTSAIPGNVVQSAGERSYQVQTPNGLSRRNRSHLHERPVDNERSTSISHSECPRSPVLTRSKTGTIVRPPNRLTL